MDRGQRAESVKVEKLEYQSIETNKALLNFAPQLS
jgi:hypothetical protein